MLIMKVKQINIRKSTKAHDHLCENMINNPNDVYLIQEPYYSNKKRVTGLPRGYKVFGTQKGSSRAIIICPPSINVFACDELSNNDHCTVCLINTGTDEKIYLSSIYLDIELPTISPMLTKICDFYFINNCQAYLGLDTNAHSVFWNSPDSNKRGEDLEDFILNYNLKVLNTGNKYTYIHENGNKSIIDISLCFGNKAGAKNWKVLDLHFFSDHKMLEFELKAVKTETPKVRKIDWNKFTDSLNLTCHDTHYNIWDPQVIEKEWLELKSVIAAALDTSSYWCKIKPKSAKFWNDELHNMRSKVRSAFSQWEKFPTDMTWTNYQTLGKEYKKAIRVAKRKAWQKFMNSIVDPKSMALLNKLLHKVVVQMLTNQHNRSQIPQNLSLRTLLGFL